MTTQLHLVTQPEPEPVARARRALAGVLDGIPLDGPPGAPIGGRPGGPDLLTVVSAVGTALATLDDVRPPYPPLPPTVPAVPVEEGVRAAWAALDEAVATGGAVPDVLRYGLAARELRRAGVDLPPSPGAQ